MGIQEGGDRTVKCPPLRKLGNWHNITPGLKGFFTPVNRILPGQSVEWLVAHFTTVVR